MFKLIGLIGLFDLQKIKLPISLICTLSVDEAVVQQCDIVDVIRRIQKRMIS